MMEINIENEKYILSTSPILGKNVLSYLALEAYKFDNLNTSNEEFIKLQCEFINSFSDYKLSPYFIKKYYYDKNYKDFTLIFNILYKYLADHINFRLLNLLETNETKEEIEESIFDDYDNEHGYNKVENSSLGNKSKQIINLVYSIYETALNNNTSFYDIDTRIDFCRYLDYLNYIIHEKVEENEVN